MTGASRTPPPKRKKKAKAGAAAELWADATDPTGLPSALREKTQDQRDAEEKLAIAVGLKNDGYNSSVVTRKMITQYGMEESAAEQLVGTLYGKKVSARTGDTTYRLVGGSALVALGIWQTIEWSRDLGILAGMEIWQAFLWLGVAGAGLSQIIIAIVNHGVKEDLRKQRPGE